MATRVSTPTAIPAPGEYATTQFITLVCDAPAAAIHYTLDGSQPTRSDARFDPYAPIPIEALNEGVRGLVTQATIRAIAVREGLEDSAVASFAYTIRRRDKDVYVSREVEPGIRMIEDFDSDKMFLLTGSQRALLIDTGFGVGDLRAYVADFVGGLPLDVVITHAHPDHVACLGQFQDACDVYMHPADQPLLTRMVETFGFALDQDAIRAVDEGFVFDLGDRRLRVYEMPGHSPGCIVLLDEANGILFSGDAVGSNRPYAGDALWMQMPQMPPIDVYLLALRAFRDKVRGKIQRIYGGHNDRALYGEAYLDNLEQAAQALVEHGPEIAVPSLRPKGVWQVVVGDRLTDPNWAAINIDKETCLSRLR